MLLLAFPLFDERTGDVPVSKYMAKLCRLISLMDISVYTLFHLLGFHIMAANHNGYLTRDSVIKNIIAIMESGFDK